MNLPDDAVVTNCAGCGALLACNDRDAKRTGLRQPRGRIKERPFCAGCLDVGGAGVSGLAGGMATDFGSPSPWRENAVRGLEDGSE